MTSYLIGIDYGTGGAKACIIDQEANILGYAYREFTLKTNKLGWSEHDPKCYWPFTCEMIKECLNESGINPKEIRGIGTSSAMPSLVMVDSTKKEIKYLKSNIGEDKIFDITGNRLDDHPVIVNLLWEKNNRLNSYEKIYKALSIDGYIRLKLTGKASLNYSVAALYGVAYDIRKNTFNQEILDKIGIRPEILPDVFPCEEIIGELTEEAALETGLVPGIPVVAGQIDCNASWVGAGAIYEGDIQMNLGTVGNFGIIHKDKHFLKSMIACAYTIDSEETYVTVPTTTTGGQLIRYIRDNFSPYEKEMERLVGINAYDVLNLEAKNVEIGSNGLIILPYFMGERTPIWDVNARGVIFGLSLSHNKSHIIRAMMESVAYALYHSFEIISETDKKINYPIVLNEGGAQSLLWRKIITDVFNVPTVLVKNRAGAPFGDAILAGVATGVFEDYSIAKNKAEYLDMIEPEQANHEQYMDFFKLYKQLYNHVKNDFKELAFLREKYY